MAQIIPEPVKRSISRLREDIHSMLDRWRHRRNDGATDGQQLSSMAFGPPVDFEDKDDEVVVVAEIPGFDENDYALAANSDRCRLADLVAEFEAVRRSHLWLLRHLPAVAWTRSGQANGHSVSVRALAYIMAGHVRHHTAILRRRLAGNG